MLNSLFDALSFIKLRLGRDEGQTMAEYGILIAVIAVIVVVAAALLGTNLSSLFNSTATKV